VKPNGQKNGQKNGNGKANGKRNGEAKGAKGSKDPSKAAKASAKPSPAKPATPSPATLAKPALPTAATGRKPQLMGVDWHPRFIEKLASIGFVKASAAAIGINPDTAYEHRERFPEFAAQWEAALEKANRSICETLESQALVRATTGVKLQTYRRIKNKMILFEEKTTEPSVPMLQFLMKNKMRGKYGEQVRTEIVGPDGTPFTPVVNATQVNINIVENFRDVKAVKTIEGPSDAGSPSSSPEPNGEPEDGS
jgi:hypothetical protein